MICCSTNCMRLTSCFFRYCSILFHLLLNGNALLLSSPCLIVVCLTCLMFCLTASLQRASFDCLTAASHGGVVCLIIFCLTRCCLSLSCFPVFHVALDGGGWIAGLFRYLIAGQTVIRV